MNKKTTGYVAETIYSPHMLENDIFIVEIPRMFTISEYDQDTFGVHVSHKYFKDPDAEMYELVKVGLKIPRLAELSAAGCRIRLANRKNRLMIYDIIMQYLNNETNMTIDTVHDVVVEDDEKSETLLAFANSIYMSNQLEFKFILNDRITRLGNRGNSAKRRDRVRMSDLNNQPHIPDDSLDIVVDLSDLPAHAIPGINTRMDF